MTSGTVEFTATQYELGDNLTAYFSWTDARWNFSTEAFATLSIYNPAGTLKEQYVEENNSEGSLPLQYRSNALGVWRARLRIWNGSSWTDLSHYTTVGEPPEPPPPEPPEPEPPPPEPPEPPTPEDCPDFWKYPVEAVLCWIIRSIEATLGMVSGGFITLLASLQQWSAAFTIEFWYFLQDPISSIKTWMNDVFVAIQNLSTQISSSISTWWNQTVIDVGVMITNATTGFKSWIDERFTGINDWWADAQTVWGTFWDERIQGVENWINDFLTKINNWYNSKIQPTIDAINSSLTDAANWIKGFPTLLSTWWNDRIIDVGVWITDATTAANEWINGFSTLINEWWNDRVIEIGIWLTDRNNEIKLWVEEGLPGWVEDMFDWAKPVISPILGIANVLSSLWTGLTKEEEEDPKITAVKDNYKLQTDRVKEILGR